MKFSKPPIYASYNFCSTIYHNSILFCAKNGPGLYKFDITIESYSELLLNETCHFSLKMLCIGDRKAYLIDNEYGIFESGADNEYIWNKISMYQTDYFSKGVNANCENSVYYSTMEDHTMSIYKFYLDEKRLYEIKNV